MKRILFCVLWVLVLGSCKSGPATGGAFGGLNQQQAQEFSGLQGSWGDARGAYRSLVTHSTGSTARAKAMAQALANSAACTPSQDGLTNPPLNANFSQDIGLNGPNCAITVQEHEGYSYSPSQATYVINHSYAVNNNTNGVGYIGINPLASFNMLSGSLQMTVLDGALSTAGNFAISSQLGDQQYAGQITVANGVANLVMNFPTFQMTAAATWQPGRAGTTYQIQGVNVSETDFATALSDFHMIDIVNVAQNAPLYLH